MKKFAVLMIVVILQNFFLLQTLAYAQTQDDIIGFLVEGQKFYEAGDLTAAALEFENILLIDRRNFTAHIWLTQIYADQKNLDKARKLLREATLQAPDHPRVLQLQQLLGGHGETSVSIAREPVITETLAVIGSGTNLRPYGLVIPEDKVKKDQFDPDLLVFADVTVVDEPKKEDRLDVGSYFASHSGPLAEVFRILETDGVNAALDKYLEMLLRDPSIAAHDDKGLVARGNSVFAPRFQASENDIEARFYYGCLQYINGLFAESLKILEPLRKNPGQYGQRLRPVLAALDQWQQQENQRIMLARRAEEERLAREAWEKEQAEKKKNTGWASVKEHRSSTASPTASAAGGAMPPSEAAKLHSEGYDLYKRGKLDEAIEKYQAALNLQESNPEFNYHMGLAWTDKGLAGDMQAFDRAISVFQRVVSLAPGDKLARDAQSMIRDIDAARKTLGE